MGFGAQFLGGVTETVGGVALFAAPELVLTKISGAFLIWHGIDNAFQGSYGLLFGEAFLQDEDGEARPTFTYWIVEKTLRAADVDKETARWVAFGVDVLSPVGAEVSGSPTICNATPQFGLPRGFSVGTAAALGR